MKITIKLFGRETGVSILEPAVETPKPAAPHTCPTQQEQFEKWKATSSSGTHFGFSNTNISDRAMAPSHKRWENY